jgi:hypothetical protein
MPTILTHHFYDKGKGTFDSLKCNLHALACEPREKNEPPEALQRLKHCFGLQAE